MVKTPWRAMVTHSGGGHGEPWRAMEGTVRSASAPWLIPLFWTVRALLGRRPKGIRRRLTKATKTEQLNKCGNKLSNKCGVVLDQTLIARLLAARTVKAFLDERHGGRYRVYNLCSEKTYDPAKCAPRARRPARFRLVLRRFMQGRRAARHRQCTHIKLHGQHRLPRQRRLRPPPPRF